MLRFLTAGESHGQALVVIIEGVPAGLHLTADELAIDLGRRQLGYGRGRRMAIEQDRAEILSGIRRGETLGSPITLQIKNRDWSNWLHTMSVEADPDESLGGARRAPVTRPRPMITAAATACATKNNIAAIRPSDVDTRGGGDASGSSR